MTDVVIATWRLMRDGRGIDRLRFQVASLEPQWCGIIVVDGSPIAEHSMIQQRLSGTKARVLSMPQGTMNLPQLWNYGVNQSSADHILISGADFIYHPCFIKTAESLYQGGELLMCQAHCLSRTDRATFDKIANWRWGKLEPFPHGELANGIQFAERQLFLDHPYDERLELLGGMDNLMRYKVEKSGKNAVWWKQQMVLHQWHKVSRYKRDKQFEENQKIISDFVKK